jgi:PadR family transcriptional regulator PadR
LEILTTSFLLDTCVLALLARGDTYGYVLTGEVTKVINISESSLYPALRRLQRDGCLEAYNQEYNGRNRRYYHRTIDGAKKFAENYKLWVKTKSSIDKIMEGVKSDDKK